MLDKDKIKNTKTSTLERPSQFNELINIDVDADDEEEEDNNTKENVSNTLKVLPNFNSNPL